MKARVEKDRYVTEGTLTAYLKIQDLCYLLALREMGFGHDRLNKVLNLGRDFYKQYRDRYCVADDVKNLKPDAPHILAMEEELKSRGYDYEDEQRKVDESKYRYHGNQFTV